MFVRKALWAIVVACGVAGCQNPPYVRLPTPIPDATGYSLTSDERALLRQRLGDGGRPRLALAMSGGGVRSSLYNFGVLKALYDDGILAEVDLISSVSGGGYLAYWLYSAQAAYPQQAFGAPLFSDTTFIRTLCNFSGRSNFVPNKIAIPTSILLPVYWDAARDLYHRRMRRTFGEFDRDPHAPIRLVDLQGLMRDHGHPYLVMNATVYGKDDKVDPILSAMFELTPLHFGQLGHQRPWGENTSQPQTHLVQAALASGAAIGPLKRSFHDPFGTDVEHVHLWDGGKTENLGALPVLRRGADALIVIDAQFDSYGEDFSAYSILQRSAKSVDIQITSRTLDDAVQRTSKRGLYIADAQYPDRRRSRVVYLKMERPAELIDAYRGTPWAAADPRAQDYERWRTAYRLYDKARGDYRNGSWTCSNPAQPVSIDDLMRFNLGLYLSIVDGDGVWWRALRYEYPWSKAVGQVFTNDFPKKTTVDQSMYLNESLAYIALGYLTAKGKVRAALKASEMDGAAL